MKRLTAIALLLLGLALTALGQSGPRTFNTIAEMLAANPNDIRTNMTVLGYRTPGDGGGGQFYFDRSHTAATNLGWIFRPVFPGWSGPAGRCLRLFDGAVTPQMAGAYGDGAHDDAAACQAALDTGLPVYFPRPPVDYLVGSTLHGHDNQQIFGDGMGRTVIRYASSNMNCLAFMLKTNASVSGITFQASGIDVWGSWATNNGCLLLACSTNITVTDCSFKNMRFGGVTLQRSADCTVKGCSFIESCGRPTISSNQWQAAGVLLLDSRHNEITRNVFRASLAYAVAGFTETANGEVSDNVISENQISGAHGYGIILYRPAGCGDLLRNKIVNNVIEDIDGNFTNPNFPSSYPYGIGIYLQSAEDSTVKGNTLRRIGLYTRDPTLTPAAIGLNGIRGAVISGNDISECYQDAVYWKDYGNSAGTNNMVTITGNNIHNIKRLTTEGTALAGGATLSVASTNGFMVGDLVTVTGGNFGTNALTTHVMSVAGSDLVISNALASSFTNTLVTNLTTTASTTGTGTNTGTTVTVASVVGFSAGDLITIIDGGAVDSDTQVAAVGPTSLGLTNPLLAPVTNASTFLVTSITKAAILGSALTNAVVIMSGNAITEADDYAVILAGEVSAQITGNTFLRNYNDLKFITTRLISIVGNTFKDTKYLSLNSSDTVRACVIRDNIFDTCTIGASLPSDGIIARENFFLDCGLGIQGGATNRLVIDRNQFSGCGSSFPVGSFILEDVPNPSVKNAALVLCTNTTATIITNLADGVQGQVVTLIAYTPITIYGGTNFLLYNGPFVSTSGETITFVRNPFGSTWMELSRARLTDVYFGTGPWDQRPRIGGTTNNVTIAAYTGYDGSIDLIPSGTGTVTMPSANVTNGGMFGPLTTAGTNAALTGGFAADNIRATNGGTFGPITTSGTNAALPGGFTADNAAVTNGGSFGPIATAGTNVTIRGGAAADRVIATNGITVPTAKMWLGGAAGTAAATEFYDLGAGGLLLMNGDEGAYRTFTAGTITAQTGYIQAPAYYCATTGGLTAQIVIKDASNIFWTITIGGGIVTGISHSP